MRNEALKFRQQGARAIKNPTLQKALNVFAVGFPMLRKRALADFPGFEQARDRAAAIKDHSLANIEALHAEFKANVEQRGGEVIRCETPEAAVAAVVDICKRRDAKLITKSKSMVSEEIALNDGLETAGLTVVETDLGEYILQLAKEPPSHIVGPALHKTRDEVAALFKKHHKRKPAAETGPELVAEARAVLREKYFAADVGITGANFLVAETGTVAIVTNEGNADLCRVLPKTHIVVTSIEKVIPALDDLSVFLRLLGRSASGQAITAYTTLISGPRGPGETQGPENFTVVLVDGGRSKLLGTPAQEILRCIKCGACMNACPVYGSVGGHAYGWVYPGPIGAVLGPALQGVEETAPLYQASTFCGACEAVCPVKIPLVKMLRFWRMESFAKKTTPFAERAGVRLWTFICKRPALYRLAVKLMPKRVWR